MARRRVARSICWAIATAAAMFAVTACGSDAPGDADVITVPAGATTTFASSLTSVAATSTSAPTTTPSTPTTNAPAVSTTVPTLSTIVASPPVSASTMPMQYYEPYGDPADYGSIYDERYCVSARNSWNEVIIGPNVNDPEGISADMSARMERVRSDLFEFPGLPAEVGLAVDRLLTGEVQLAVAFATFRNRADQADGTTYDAMNDVFEMVSPDRDLVWEFLESACPAIGQEDI